MEVTVHPSHIAGSIMAPPSKSLTQRAIAAGMLARGTTVIRNPSFCNDSLAAIGMARVLGAAVSMDNNSITIKGGSGALSPVTLHCGESGLALRMFAPVAALLADRVTLTGEGSLAGRPVIMISEAMPQFRVNIQSEGGVLPVTMTGRLTAGKAVINGSRGSQLLTGLLMSLPLLESGSEITVENLKSMPYIAMTLQLLEEFGIRVIHDDFRYFKVPGSQSYRPREYTVEGDWSGAAFLLVAGAMAGAVTVKSLNLSSLQADSAIVRVLENASCQLTTEAVGVKAERSELRPFVFDATDAPDLFPPLAALASFCSGTSRISGVSRLQHKESDRAEAIADVLGAMNIEVQISGDEMLIIGGRAVGSSVSSHNDHRIAMMAAVMALAAEGTTTIAGAEAVAKSYPGFFDDLARLGAEISR
ncbi:MAG: 3-phosphoshikimate 1-carboxyvinyltransferase [Bacteroidales bacterium]|nr:3-phosphoshikimate 1-carboxyvinyltransferase [Bacteroidales bacterium]MDT8372958.1 3-phosphoshikimate 1-carboxyvinyltransferase [Bacteroidales bacterium]